MNVAQTYSSFRIGRFSVYAVLAFAFCFYSVPLLWLALAATRSQTSLFTEGPFALGSWEDFRFTWTNLTTYNGFQIALWTKNSIIYSIGSVSLALISSIPAGYALALYNFPGRKLILVLTLVAMITPSSAIALPIFLEMNLLGLNNTYAGFILATGFFPFGVYLAYIYYATSLPRGVLDSAQVDGCNRFQLFMLIGLPLAKPIVALVAFFSFLANWSNYFLAFVLLTDDELYNLPVGLAALISSSGALGTDVANDIPIKKPEAILAALMVIAPVLIIFLLSQRYVRSGTLSGAEKG